VALRIEDIDLAADRELVERWQAGEHAAFDDLYRRYYTRLRSYCQKRVGDRDTAEEIAQEAFVKALQALPTFAGERRFYPWVTVIASRLCVDHHRRQGRCRPTEDVDPGAVDGDHGTRLAFLADVDNLDRALRRLGPRHAEVLDLRERKGMTYAEIADHLQVPQSTVEALLFRARKALRREFFAVAGDGRLVAIPFVGALLRRLATARVRFAEHSLSISQLTAGIASGAMAVVIAAAPFAEPMAVAADPIGRIPAATHHIVTTSAAMPPVAPAILAPAATPPTKHVAPAAPAAAAPGVEIISGEQARSDAADMPLGVDAGSLGLGADPAQPLAWLFEENG
jgi:RNA polymerase sigma-70 factor (ECF subfamily)